MGTDNAYVLPKLPYDYNDRKAQRQRLYRLLHCYGARRLGTCLLPRLQERTAEIR